MKPRKTEHPILFSTPMVQAILEGRKTMTRRIVKPIADLTTPDFGFAFEKMIGGTAIFNGMLPTSIECPYRQPGDKLWVRETWCKSAREWFFYKAGCSDIKLELLKEEGFKWKPSIHMPKAAARIWIMITDVRVERLQDISEEDAKAEGVEKWIQMSSYRYKDYTGNVVGFWENINPVGCKAAIASFNSLWIKINGMDSFKSNPWVWVIEFKRIEPCQ